MKLNQNTSHAVMAQRHEPADSADDFPTPPWATRALMEHVLSKNVRQRSWLCWEPACGRGYMADTLREYFSNVYASDIIDYGVGANVHDFTSQPNCGAHWIITNPPFKLAEVFVSRAFEFAHQGVAMLCRTTFLEGKGRYERLFRSHPPLLAQFVERVPIVKGRIVRGASSATAYAWFVWGKDIQPGLTFIPPCRQQLERNRDYD